MHDKKRSLPRTRLGLGSRWLTIGPPSIGGALWAKYDSEPRDILPEPLDYFDHASNFAGTFGVCTVVALTGAWAARLSFRDAEESTLRKLAYGSAAVIGIAMNAIAELKLGFDPGSVGEPYDFVYGVAGAVAAAASVEIASSSEELV